MRVAALALAAVAGTACSKGSLQQDAAGAGSIGLDAGVDGVAGVPGIDASAGTPGIPGIPGRSCGTAAIAGGHLAVQYLVLLDRSPAGDAGKWAELTNTLSRVIMANLGDDWGLYTFPKVAPACSAGTTPPTIDFTVSADNARMVAANVGYELSGGGGMPAAAAIAVGAAHLRTLSTGNPKFLVLVTDRAPTCAGAAEPSAADPAQAQSDAVAAVAAAAAEGFPALVVAPSTTVGADATALNALARAGGYPQRQGGVDFFTEATLAVMTAPAPAQICVVSLTPSPPVPNAVTVTFNGSFVPRDPLHFEGWDYLPPGTPTTPGIVDISFYGTWCQLLRDSRSWEVRATYGCPTDVWP